MNYPWFVTEIDPILLVSTLVIVELLKPVWAVRILLWVVRGGVLVLLLLLALDPLGMFPYLNRFGASGFDVWLSKKYGTGFLRGDMIVVLDTYALQIEAYKTDLLWLGGYIALGFWLHWRLSCRLAKSKMIPAMSGFQKILS